MASRYQVFMITFRHTTVGRNPLDERSGQGRDLYLTIPNTHNRQASVSPAGFEPAIPATERQQTHALDRAATGTAYFLCHIIFFHKKNTDVKIMCTNVTDTQTGHRLQHNSACALHAGYLRLRTHTQNM